MLSEKKLLFAIDAEKIRIIFPITVKSLQGNRQGHLQQGVVNRDPASGTGCPNQTSDKVKIKKADFTHRKATSKESRQLKKWRNKS